MMKGLALWRIRMSNHTNDYDKEDVVMTVHDVAKYLRLSEATVYKLAKDKKIPAIKIGRAWRFQRRVVEEWIKRRTIHFENDTLHTQPGSNN